ncbi:unnamed protein product [Mucor fragilis]
MGYIQKQQNEDLGFGQKSQEMQGFRMEASNQQPASTRKGPLHWRGKVTPRTLKRERCWKFNGFSLSLALHKYRNRSIDLLSQGDTLDTLRILSLNGILLVQPSPLPSLRQLLAH